MIVPKAITIPMLLSVPPNPSVKLLMIVVESSPPRKPIAKDATRSVKKGWIFNRVVATIMKTITKTK
jgi:hypothetical protein